MYTRYHSILILVAILMIWNGADASERGGRRIVPVSSAPGRGAPAHAPPPPPPPPITMESLFGQYLKSTKDDTDKRWLKSISRTDFLNQYNQAITSVDNISKHGETNPVHLVVYSILCKSALAAGREPIAGRSASGSQVCPKIDTIQNPAINTLVRIIGSVTFPGLVLPPPPPPQLPGVILSVGANESVLERLQNIVPQTVDWPQEPVNLSDLVQLWNLLVNRTPNTIIPPNTLLVVGLIAMAIFENSPINIGGDNHALYETRICENLALHLNRVSLNRFILASNGAQSCADIGHDPKPEIVALYNKYLSLPRDNTPTTREQVVSVWNNFVERPRGYIEAVNAITSRQTAIALIQLSRLIVGDRKSIPTTYLPESLCPIIATDQISRREFTCPQPPAATEDDAVAQRWTRRDAAIENLQAAIASPPPPPPPLVSAINQFDRSIIRFWSSKCTSARERQAWFERMISMYDVETGRGIGQFFRRSQFGHLYTFLQDTYSDDESFARISRESRLLYPANGHTVDEIVHAAIWRVPGYQGGLQTAWYNPDKFSQVYENVGSTDDAAVPNMRAEATARLIREADPRIDPADDDAVNYALSHRIVRTYTFGILSPAKVYRTDHPTPGETHWIHVLHVWGVNFESDQTQDWNAIVTPNMPGAGGAPFNIDGFTTAYAQRMKQLFTIIKQGIIETANILTQHHRDVTTLRVRIPGIGQGAFLRGFEDHPELPRELVEICNFQFLKAMNDVLFSKSNAELFASAFAETRQRIASGNFSLSLRYVEFGALPEIVLRRRAQLASVITEDQDTGPRSYIQGRVLFDYPEGDPTTYHLLINAWDPMTFIGNGGSRDGSLDGWIAGGYAFPNVPRFASTAWLSNLHMIPSLINNMVAVEEGV